MASISRQLVTLARGLDGESAAKRRTAAQVLALSTALDPGNSQARALIADLVAGRGQPADPLALVEVLKRLSQILEWLETPEAGSAGQALAACLGDVLRASAPRSSEAHAANPERGAWAGWVPGLSAYEQKVPLDIPEEPMQDEPEESPILLAQAQVTTPLWRNPNRTLPGKWSLNPEPLEMTAEAVEPEEENRRQRFSLVIGADEQGRSLREIVPAIKSVLSRQHGTLPPNIQVTIGGEALQAALLSKNRPAISAAAAVLASAALSGREPEATIIGSIDENGAFTLPPNFWEQLRSLNEGRGGRLVLPAAAAEYLPSILTLEQPLFFLKYEVLLASNFQELLDRSAKIPEGSLAGASAKFLEIRSKLGNQPIGPYVANSFVRRRLAEIAEEAPYHFSARMLAVQGAGNRPFWVVRPVLAAEIRRAIEPLNWLLKRGNEPFGPDELELLGSSWESCRAQVDGLVRYCAKEDREILGAAQNLMTTLRTLDRSLRTRNVDIWNFDALRAFTREHKKVSKTLALAAGEPEPETKNRSQ